MNVTGFALEGNSPPGRRQEAGANGLPICEHVH